MVSCPHGLGTVRTGVRPLMSWRIGKRVTGAGARSAPGPSAGVAICPARILAVTPAASSARASTIGRFLAALASVTYTKDTIVHASTTPPLPLALATALLVACSGGGDANGNRPDTVRSATAEAPPAPCTTGTAELTLPAGFCATVFADSILQGRHAAVASNGDVYVTIEGTKPSPEKQAS